LAIVVDAFYLVLDAIVITLGLLFVWKWGKKGLLAVTMWLLVIGLMAYAVGDALFLAGNDLGYKTAIFAGTDYEMESADFAFIGAVILWIIAFFIPVKFALVDSKKQPQGEEAQPGAPPAGGPPQQPPQMQAPQQQMPAPQQAPPQQMPQQQMPPPQQFQGQAPPPQYQQVPPPAYQHPAPSQTHSQPGYQGVYIQIGKVGNDSVDVRDSVIQRSPIGKDNEGKI